ncbi:MAG: phosphate ABC transporter permease PstA [Bacilli bacterium]|nr:phosphate ABC transporter permease PstA [Bacilli bacterium]
MRARKEAFLYLITMFFSLIGLIVLLTLVGFIVKNGLRSLSWDFLTSNYYEEVYNLHLEDDIIFDEYINPMNEMDYFTSRWGVSFRDDLDYNQNPIVIVSYIDQNSPLRNMEVINQNNYQGLFVGMAIDRVLLEDEGGNLIIIQSKNKAEIMASSFQKGMIITDLVASSRGGGIRGSLYSTIILILLTLIIALPLGIGGAIYLNEYARPNRITRIIRSFIEATTGIPSIIFGMVGSAVFIPVVSTITHVQTGTLLSGAFTLAMILLPIIIRTVEESLSTIKQSYREASLALGASRTQTIFRVVLPNAIGGILTATILSIGRIIGESAALIYAVGTVIKDRVSIFDRSTSLAVHIWTLMSGENPNFESACAISIIILILVLLLSIMVKGLTKRLRRMEVVS